ncbi:hypothetical protein PR048_024995 [Dryococelus australis]|uniref:Uncharacterized protein n=1 Tax=Dryococelus australis TaxID=614101 RepID=A0ABQ9GQ71_9NEOP|nr:hypothetical protein PR048_024995 [Dryococelus australis]
MCSIKTRGGLTRGSGLTEIQQAIWLNSMPVCCFYNLEMQDYSTNKEVGENRRSRDISDFQKVMECMKPISPFDCDTHFRNIITGITADPCVNVHELHSIGTEIINKMVEKLIYAYYAKRSDRVKTLEYASAVTSAEKNIYIDPTLLFQRMMTFATVGDMNLADVLNYELCAYPPVLFESRNLSRQADKPQLARAILDKCGNLCTPTVPETQANVQYVLDGGSLLHYVPWKPGDTYQNIANSYANFTFHNYGRAIFVGQKENFLANDTNKQCITMLISEALTKIGCTVQHADGDADFDIVHSAMSSFQIITTVTVGEYTDLLVLLLHHAKNNGFKL